MSSRTGSLNGYRLIATAFNHNKKGFNNYDTGFEIKAKSQI